MMLSASLCWAVYTVLVRRWGVAPVETTIGVTLLSALCFLPVYAVAARRHCRHAAAGGAAAGLYQGVLVAIVAMVLYMQALARSGRWVPGHGHGHRPRHCRHRRHLAAGRALLAVAGGRAGAHQPGSMAGDALTGE